MGQKQKLKSAFNAVKCCFTANNVVSPKISTYVIDNKRLGEILKAV